MIGAARLVLRAAVAAALLALAAPAAAQDPTGTIEGAVTDSSSAGVVAGARVSRHAPRHRLHARGRGRRRRVLPAAAAAGRRLSRHRRRAAVRVAGRSEPVQVNVSQTRAGQRAAGAVVGERSGHRQRHAAQLVDTSTNALGRVVTGREIVDLPLNGRNFTQLGLLQTGVAPLTAGVATAGGIAAPGPGLRRQRHAARAEHVSGRRRPEHEPHGRRLRAEAAGRRDRRVPHPDAERAAGIRRHRRRDHQRRHALGRQPATTAASTSSCATTPSTRATSSRATSSRSSSTSSAAPSAARSQREPAVLLRLLRRLPQQAGHHDDGDGADARRSGRATSRAWARPLLNLAAGGTPFPGNRLPAAAINPVARNVVNLYPLGNVSPSIYRETLVGENKLDQVGAPRRLQRVVERSDLRALLLLGRPQPQPGVGARHRRARLSDPRRSGDAFGAGCRATRILSPTLTHAVRVQHPALQVLLRSAPEPDAAERARLRLRVVERGRARGRRSSTSPATRRSAAPSPARASRRRRRSRCRTPSPGRAART